MAKNGIETFLKKNSNKIWTGRRSDPKPEQEASLTAPLCNGIISSSRGCKLANFEKKRKLKIRDLIKNSFIISKLRKFTKLHPDGKVSFFWFLEHPNMKTHHSIVLIEPGLLLLSEFQMEAYFRRFFWFGDMCLVRESGVDWGAGHRKGIDT